MRVKGLLGEIVLKSVALGLTMAPMAQALAQTADEGSDGVLGIEFAPDDEPAPPPPPPSPAVTTNTSSEPAASPETAAPAGGAADSSFNEGARLKRLRRGELSAEEQSDHIFGRYRVRVGASRPNFTDMRFYDELYGNTRWHPSLSADWFFFDWYATLGLSFKGGYYSADGHAARDINKNVADITADDITVDQAGPTTLTFIPLQIALAAEFTPFARKWVVFDAWLGIERTYWQEVRTAKASTSSSSSMMRMAMATAETTSDDMPTNRGWKSARVMGAAINILLNPLDPTSPASMRGVLGLRSVYFSPYVEIIDRLGDGGVSFGRKVFGIGFTFESI